MNMTNEQLLRFLEKKTAELSFDVDKKNTPLLSYLKTVPQIMKRIEEQKPKKKKNRRKKKKLSTKPKVSLQ